MKRLIRLATSVLPFVIIGALLYAALFIKPRAVGASVKPPPIQARDAFYSVATPTESIIWAVGRNAKIVRSDDSGKTWKVQKPARRANLQSILAWDSMRAVVVGNAGAVMRTEDGGSVWQEVKGLPETIGTSKLVRVKAMGEGVAIATGEFGTILQSRDGGKTWAAIGKSEDISWNDISVAGDAWVIVGEFGHIRRSMDSGVNWREVPSPVKTSLNAVAFRDGLTGVAVGLDGVILETSDGGMTWSQRQAPVREHLFDVLAKDQDWIASGDHGLLLTAVSGSNWTARRISDRDYGWHADVELKDGKVLLAGATFGILDLSTQTFQRYK